MLQIALNPGFVLLIGGVLVFAAPSNLRAGLMTLSAIGALGLLLAPDFGRYGAFAQIGLTMAPLALDSLNYLFGIAFIGLAILISIYASAQRDRFENAATMLLMGAATSALFVGDLVSFVAAAELAGLAAAWIVFCSSAPNSSAAGVRLLLWHGLEGLLLLAGVAFQLSDGLRSAFGAIDARTIGGALFLSGLAIRVGAPLAHVWLKDAVAHASPAGAVAIAVYGPLVGVYALSRGFPGEASLLYIGLAMMAIGAVFACAADDLRAAASYSFLAQIGVTVAAIGVGTPASTGAAAMHAFAIAFSYALVLMALGIVARKFGGVRASALSGVLAAAPITSVLLALGCAAAAPFPGTAAFVSYSLLMNAAAPGSPLAWGLFATAGLAAAHTGVRPVLALAGPRRAPLQAHAGIFPMALASALCGFLIVAIGVTPAWLYALAPTAPQGAAPYVGASARISALAASAAVYAALDLLRLTPRGALARLLDVDALYRGPLAASGRWLGVMLLRLYGVWQTLSGALAARAGAAMTAFARLGDQPYAGSWTGAVAIFAIAAILAALSIRLP